MPSKNIPPQEHTPPTSPPHTLLAVFKAENREYQYVNIIYFNGGLVSKCMCLLLSTV